MIGFLRGKLISRNPPLILLDVQGVGYEVEVPMSTLFNLPESGVEVSLLCHLAIRDDAHVLYGFASEAERQLFKNLIKVTGVGAKLALTILSGTSVDGFVRCVQQEDTAALVKLPGIGRKTAERLIVDMRDRIDQQALPAVTASATNGVAISSSEDEAFNALQSLGYKPAEIRRMLDSIETDDMDTAAILQAVLQSAGASLS